MLALACGLVGASAAHGAAWSTGTRVPGRIELAGSHVEWLIPLRGDALRLYDARAGHRPRRVQTLPGPGPDRESFVDGFAASASTVALVRSGLVGPHAVPGGTDWLVGARGGRLVQTAHCDTLPGTGPGSVDVWGTRVATIRCDETVQVEDRADPSATAIVGHDAQAVRLAGRYVAWLEHPRGMWTQPDVLVVYDLQAGSESYRASAPDGRSRVGSFDLADDGTLAFGYGPQSEAGAVAWASPAQPTAHRVPLAKRVLYTLKVARGRIAFARNRDPDDRFGEIGVMRIGASQPRLLTRRGAGLVLDLGGSSIAFATRDCRGVRVIRSSVARGAAAARPRRCKRG